MTEQERYEIDKDFVNNIEYVWDTEKPIGQIEDEETIKKLVNLLNKQDKIINKLTEIKDKYNQSMLDVEEVNEILRKENEELKLDNDIKYWKQEYLQLSNHQQVIFHELAEAFKQGYKPSKEYQKMRNDEKKRIEENKQKMERLRI